MYQAAWQRLLETLTAGPTHIVEREARNTQFASIGVEYVTGTARFELIPGGHADFQINGMSVRVGYILKGQENTDPPYFYLSITRASPEDGTPPAIFGKILSAIVFADDPKLALAPTTINDMHIKMRAALALQYCTLFR